MRHSRRSFQNIVFKTTLFGVSFLCLIFGLCLCLIKSPEDKANQYLRLAEQYADSTNKNLNLDAQTFLIKEKQNLIHHALAINPDRGSSWAQLATILAQLHDIKAAEKAREIAYLLDFKTNLPLETLTAMVPLNNPEQDQIALSDNLFQLSFTY